MAGADKRSMGIEIHEVDLVEAERLAAVAGLKKSDVLRMAIKAGLPDVARRLDPQEATR